ncbi:hypothetical protein CH063_10299 [Colletotrichum higginsianum]|uniref:Uncharacterized protein n=1 Tax=Colletotrichum higginsianum (strain IMI 349063) TaxID=759273 RepID=H1VGX1_COLHI|nr:hypothetical protein CH063_10299 [Colletotrichum higginsianum]
MNGIFGGDKAKATAAAEKTEAARETRRCGGSSNLGIGGRSRGGAGRRCGWAVGMRVEQRDAAQWQRC